MDRLRGGIDVVVLGQDLLLIGIRIIEQHMHICYIGKVKREGEHGCLAISIVDDLGHDVVDHLHPSLHILADT